MPNDFVSMDYILTFTGMVVVVNLLTQFTKNLFRMHQKADAL